MDKVKKILQGLATSLGKINKLSLPATILIASLVIGGFYYASEANKSASIEKQQQVELQVERQAKMKAEQAEAYKKLDLSFCLDKADTAYWAYMKLNGTTKKDGTIWATNDFWDRAEKVKQNAIDNCYVQYK